MKLQEVAQKALNDKITTFLTDAEKAFKDCQFNENGRFISDEVEATKQLAEKYGFRALNSHIYANFSVDITLDSVSKDLNFRCSFELEKASELLKDFKESIRKNWSPKYIKSSFTESKSNTYYRSLAESVENADCIINLFDESKLNFATATKAGNKKLAEVFRSQCEKWANVYLIAQNVNYEELKIEKLAKANLEIRALFDFDNNELNKPEALKYDTYRTVYNLFKSFNLEPIRDLKIVLLLKAAERINTNELSFDDYVKKERTELEKREEEYKVKWLKKDGFPRSLSSHKQREEKSRSKNYIDEIKEKLDYLFSNENEIKKYCTIK